LEESSEREDPETREEMDEGAPTSNESEKKDSLRKSLRAIFSWRNYSVYLITSWIYSGFAVIYSFLTLYLWEIGWEFIVIGGALTATAALSALSRFLGGYVGDVTNRKNLAVIAMFMMATYHLAFIMDNIPKEHSGLALSLFRMGNSFGILTLLAFGALLPLMAFPDGFRFIYLFSGIVLVLCAIGRAVFLKGDQRNGRSKEKSIWGDFVSENMNAVRLIRMTMPIVLAIVVLDGLSDSIFTFGAVLYTREFVGIGIEGINIMLLAPLVISIPLLFRIGRMSDLMGMKRSTIIVYSIMPVCAALLMVAPTYPYWVPMALVNIADSLLPGLDIVLTTPFLALVLKSTNDILWGLVLITMIQKTIPRTDTSKILAVLWTLVHIISSIGPFVGGAIFEFLDPPLLFALVMITNLMILGGVAYFGIEKEEQEPEDLARKMETMESTIQQLKDEIEEFRARRGLPG
jgi:MFS family permease